MGISIKITADVDQLELSLSHAEIIVPRTPMSGNQLPSVTYRNETQWELRVTFADSPFSEDTFAVSSNGGEYTPTWTTDVVAQAYPYDVSEDDSEGVARGGTTVRPVNGDITITVQS